ncbi:uncharacterized protein LOC108911307 [Anoplophora glabripennis]|uniref:uncharacterized protein LOC108911307 n=1 Tax=Anoplophora glabripennis TaxID=217634 RepID=UPI000874CD81|nr:uncharacterized protein LOC108911307 [Anoplophora glabripennis]
MPSLKLLIVFFAVLTVCCCDSHKKKHKYDLYWHGFHYLTFLAFKVKFLLVLGFIFTVGLVAGKFFALVKLVEYMKKAPDDHHHSEKIVYVSLHGSVDHSPIHGFSQPGLDFGKSYPHGGGPYQDSYPPGYSVDQLPPGAEVSGAGGQVPGPGQGFEGNYAQGPPPGYGRSNGAEKHSISGYVKLFQHMIRKFNITDIAFNDLNLKSDACRRKFVCEADFSSKGNIILKLAFNIFSDDNYSRYKTRKNITSIEECSDLYTNCVEVT